MHDAPAHAAAPLAADCFSVGALLLEVLTGKTPRWNQARPTQAMARAHARARAYLLHTYCIPSAYLLHT